VITPALNVLVASGVAPSLKITVPVGVPLPGADALTVAVNVTVWPDTLGFAEEDRAVEVLSIFTVCVSGDPVLSLPLKLLLPP
jgi:hypothetical protein